MKTKNLVALSLAACATLHAGPRTSLDFAITADTADAGGTRTTSTNYTSDGSVGGIVGISAEATSAIVAKHGYIGQLYDLLGYGLLASNYYPAELGTTQLFPVRTADDGTNVVIPTTGFTFNVVSGPVASISPTGLVTAAAVYQNTTAIVGATSAAFAGQLQLQLHVQDTIPDNFGSYAGDGIPDSWQFQYFGLDNPLAAPGADANATGQTNLFKYTAGLNPLDPNARFVLEIRAGLTVNERRLVFFPRLPDRTYTLEYRPDFGAGQWNPLGGTTLADDGSTRTVTDPVGVTEQRFYRVKITKP